jgi:inward rectifier potassium channel
VPHRKLGPVIRGDVEVRNFGRRLRRWSDPYYFVLTLSWPRFFATLLVFFLGVNLLFALAYWLLPGSIANARPGSFVDAMFFSIETIATVGYGEMAPASFEGHLIAAVEIIVGLTSLAVVTGLVFARFSKPTARVLFSKKAVIRNFNGQRVLMLRVANERLNRIVEPTAHLGFVRQELTQEGEVYYRIYDLPLERQRNQVFELTWTLIHRIDETSPLYGCDAARFAKEQARVTVSIHGHDENFAAPVYALHTYTPDSVLIDHRFVDVILDGHNGKWIVDLTRFHDAVPMVKKID